MLLLQRIEILVPAETAPLFVSSDATGAGTTNAKTVDGDYALDGGSRQSFDSYFGSFWENYWFEFTAVRSVHLGATVRGKGSLRVLRRTPQCDICVLGEESFDSDAPTHIRIDVGHDGDARGQAGRIWMEVIADDQVRIVDAGWYTDQPPVREVKLNVAFATFNRIEYLSRVIQTLDKDSHAVDAVAQVTIVNQGEPFTKEDLLGTSVEQSSIGPKIVILPQANMGGCGGYTRGIVTMLNDASLTHVLLLDDDIQIHTDSILRASRFLAFVNDDVALGGHMLNLHRPLIVYEAGAQLDPVTTKPDPCDLESAASTASDLDVFLATRTVTFNGWWFFAISREQVDRIGLPLPCFIRGDDVEYGVRLGEFGLRTVSVPGIAVWHEPFYMKLGGWQYYFETRNRLELAAIHGIGSWFGIRKNLFGTFVRDIAMARYHSVMFMLSAVEDYLGGPETAISSDDSALRRCSSIMQEYGPTRVAETMPVSEPPRTVVQRITARLPGSRYVGRAHTAALSLTRLVRVRNLDEIPTFEAQELQPDVVAGLDQYRVQEDFGNGVWLYQRRVGLERALWKRALTLIPRVGPIGSFRQEFEATDYWREWWSNEFADAGSPAVERA